MIDSIYIDFNEQRTILPVDKSQQYPNHKLVPTFLKPIFTSLMTASNLTTPVGDKEIKNKTKKRAKESIITDQVPKLYFDIKPVEPKDKSSMLNISNPLTLHPFYEYAPYAARVCSDSMEHRN